MKWLGAAIWLLALFFLSYHVRQADFHLLLLSTSIAFGGMMLILSSHSKVYWLIGFGLLARVMVIPGFPALSDDLYRYVWDGLCWLEGINAYTHSPVQINHLLDRPDLLEAMNSPEYHTIYPTIPQAFFGLSAWLSNGDVYWFQIVLKMLLLLGESLGIFWLMRNHKAVINALGFWILNPLVIIETYSNAHFEILILLPLMWALFALTNKQSKSSALALGAAVGTKLVPMMLAPLLALQNRQRGQLYTFLLWLAIAVLVIMTPLWFSLFSSSEVLDSVDLFFRKFEFNASIYFLLQNIGFAILGYNAIAYVGPFLGVLALVGILWISIFGVSKMKNVFEAALWIYAIYFAMSTTVHPWYVLTPLGICLFTTYRWPILWSYLVFLSYGKYGLDDAQWPMYVFLEYALLAVFIGWEVWKKKKSVAEMTTDF